MIAQVGHVGHDQSPWPGAHDRFEMMVHHRHADRQRVVEAETDIADAVADQDHVDDGISPACRHRIIGCGHHEPPAVTHQLLQRRDGDRRPIR